ncbi:cytochrome c oxidase assembly protein [Cellvibrio japonicus]|uniref:Cytochrome c oxidase assembly protein CtaG n=1 Tax=Cellvibrio japonicus (strain Ueda107) TaxID=498211 RepID=B3PKW0_CELJU|nr:cytochrome c oxidase assembly protein [Cellvibrio japonicus]ACE84984.1 cytochrome oxidase assembly factor [Cellvibrio japonicus Ueda107]QEI11517.1 cytochrome c oxidase assembly protein [Cellvibrio japonicus]QEI15091.1 cytochrome c oxidase assembly protein [Cellvibrio japonicus]QEI18671.1 cytochrome c oxidase assembly protein [Cellvibrio japonicus]
MSKHTALVYKLLLACTVMFAFGFALVPLYDVFCRYTGLNGKTDNTPAVASKRIDGSRKIHVEFIANIDSGMPWNFEPDIAQVDVNPGQVKVVSYLAVNHADEAMVGRAVPSVSPGQAAKYFKKIECFCFVEQPLDAGQEKHMPVQFYIDADIPEEFNTITLSYRMYPVNPQMASH